MIHYIGKISYSLYLIHLPVLFAFIHMLNGKIPMSLILFGTIVMTFIVASIMHHVVERPAIKLGKYLTGTKKKQVKQNEFQDLVNITE